MNISVNMIKTHVSILHIPRKTLAVFTTWEVWSDLINNFTLKTFVASFHCAYYRSELIDIDLNLQIYSSSSILLDTLPGDVPHKFQWICSLNKYGWMWCKFETKHLEQDHMMLGISQAAKPEDDETGEKNQKRRTKIMCFLI